jgi:hypothetical protein
MEPVDLPILPDRSIASSEPRRLGTNDRQLRMTSDPLVVVRRRITIASSLLRPRRSAPIIAHRCGQPVPTDPALTRDDGDDGCIHTENVDIVEPAKVFPLRTPVATS